MTIIDLITPAEHRALEEAVRDGAFARDAAARTATVETDEEEVPSWD